MEDKEIPEIGDPLMKAVAPNLLKKLSSLRKDVCEADWTPDKFMVISKTNTRIDYISVTKMKATMNPLFQRNGLEISLCYDKPEILDAVGGQPSHVMVRLRATIYDIDTGDSITDEVWGESGDIGDKAIGKAETYALKTWLASRNLLADGIDPDRDDDAVEIPGFVKRKDEVEVKSKVLSQGIKPPVKKEPEPEEEDEPMEVPSEPMGESEVPKISEPSYQPNKPQANAIKHILDRFETKLANKTIAQTLYDQMRADYATICDAPSALQFIQTYKEMGM